MKHADLIDLTWTQQPVRTLQLRVCPACGKDNLVSRCGFLEVHNLGPKALPMRRSSLVEGRRYCRGSGQQLPRAQRREPRKVWTDEERKQRLLQHDLDDHARMRNAEVAAAAHTMRPKWSGPKASLIVVDDPIPAR